MLQRGFVPDVSSHWQARLGMLIPLTVLFKALGPSLGAAVILPFFWSLLSVVLAYVAGQVIYQDARISLLASLFVAVFPLDVIYSTQYFPDLALAALTGLSFILFLIAQKSKGNAPLFAISGLVLGLAYLHRETALFLVLPMIALIIVRRRWRHGYLVFATVLCLVFCAELVVFEYLCGDPIHRIRAVLNEGVRANHPDPMKRQSNPLSVENNGNVEDLEGDDTQSAPARPRVRDFSIVRMIFRPLLCLAFNQEFGLFYYAIAAAACCLLWRRDKSSTEALLWFGLVGGYTLWGTVKLSEYQPLYTWPRYLSTVTIPGMLLLSRWITTWSSLVWRRCIVLGLIGSSMVCVYLDNSRTRISVGDKLLGFYKSHQEKELVLYGHAFSDLFVANRFQQLSNVSFLGLGRSGGAKRFDPALRIYTSASMLSDCYVAIPLYKTDAVPKDWRPVTTILRTRRWFVDSLDSAGGFLKSIAERLSPVEGYQIYYVPPQEPSELAFEAIMARRSPGL